MKGGSGTQELLDTLGSDITCQGSSSYDKCEMTYNYIGNSSRIVKDDEYLMFYLLYL